MVIGNLTAVADLLCKHISDRYAENSGGAGSDGRNPAFHIVRQETAVGSRIGTELFLIQGLKVVQRLLGGEAQNAVCISLERCQVIERRGFFRFFFLLHAADHRRCAFTGGFQIFRIRLVFQLFTDCRKIAGIQLHRIKRLRLKRLDFRFPLYQQCQRGRHHASDIQRAVIQHREKSCGVDAHQPVRLASAKRSIIEMVVLAAVAQVFKALADCRILHRRNPEALHGFHAACQKIDGAENQLALASRVAGIDDFRHIRTAHQLRQQIQLLFLIAPDAVLPAFGNDGELFTAPSGIRLVIYLSGSQFRQVAEAPGNEKISSFAITVPALVSAKDGRNGFGHRGLFGNHKLHIIILSFSDWCRCCLRHYTSSVSSGWSSSMTYSSSSSSSSSPKS